MSRFFPLSATFRLPCLGALALLVLCARPAVAQNTAVFEAATNRKDVPLGNRFEVTFTLREAESRGFRPPDFQGFKMMGPSETTRGMTMVNGKTSIHQSWSFELEAVREGSFTIGPATVTTTEGKTLRTQPVTVRVVPAQVANVPPGANEDLFVAGECEPAVAVVGQQVKYRIKVYTRLNVEAFDLLELPKFDGFYSRELKRFDTRVQYQTLRGKKYAVRTLHEMALFAQAPGEVTIGTARLRFEVQNPSAPSTIFGPATTPVLLQTAPAKLRVKDLPEPLPAGFSGVVGQYEVKFSLDRDSMTTDDAITLLIEIQGTGDARRLVPPRINLPPELETFDPKVREEEEYETAEEAVHRRIFEYVILPKKPGNYTISPEFVFFDPDSSRYIVRRPDQPMVITVAKGQNAGQLLPDSTGIAPPDPGAGSDLFSRVKQWASEPWFWLILITPVFLLLLILLLRKKRPPAPVLPPAARVTHPPSDHRSTRERFANARRLLSNDAPRLFFDELYKALGSWLADHLNVPAASLTPGLLRERLAQRRVPEARIEALLQVWRTCEQAIFAGQHAHLNMDTTWRQAEEIVQGLENDLRKN